MDPCMYVSMCVCVRECVGGRACVHNVNTSYIEMDFNEGNANLKFCRSVPPCWAAVRDSTPSSPMGLLIRLQTNVVRLLTSH